MKKLMLLSLIALSASGVSAADFFSTDKPAEFLTLGARIGVNTTNRTLDGNALPDCYHRENWGTGFDIGVVAGLNIRDYLTIQPGFFFESRSGNYTLLGSRAGSGLEDDGSEIAQVGKRNSYNFTIPVMAIVNFNIADEVVCSAEAGPYVAFVINSKLDRTHYVFDGPSNMPLFDQKAATVDFGFKLGVSTTVMKHYYCGVHYLAGCVPAWKNFSYAGWTKNFGGVTKGWVFSLGYNF